MNKFESNKVAEYVENHDIYLFGPMGVGKTTLVNNIREITPVNYVSMGEITRSAIADNNTEVKQMIEQGGKLPLPAIQRLISPHIDTEDSYILDGVPRHPDEAEWIKSHASRRHLGSIALTLSADSDTILDRIEQRLKSGERSETPDRIAARLAVYENNQIRILEALRPALQEIITLDTSRLTPHEVLEDFHERI